MLGVFLALDFFLFYVFWEVMLLPMYFLIGVWGGPRREYAAIKFFLYTLLGSVLMLIAILMLYFNSDLTNWLRTEQLARRPTCRNRLTTAIAEDAQPQPAAHVQSFWPWRRSGSTPIQFDGEPAVAGQVAAVVGLRAVVHRLCDQGADRAGAHLVARRARRGPHADLDDPGRRAVEDGRLRHHPHLLPDLS